MSTLRQHLHQRYWHLLSRYLDKRQPASDKVTLVQKLIYILPTRYGWWFTLLIILLYLLGTNYQNNLILLLCYLLLSVFLFSIALCYYNLSGLTLQCPQPAEGFAGDNIPILLALSSNKPHLMLDLGFLGQRQTLQLAEFSQSLTLQLHAPARGRFNLTRLKISSQYPFGLWRAWSYVALAQHYWVYPCPDTVQHQSDQAETERQQQVLPSGDVLAPYRSGDSLRHLVWKRLARDPANPVVRQQYAAPLAEASWVVVPKLTGDALERALRQACYRLLALEQSGNQYGLKLPQCTINQGQGSTHLQRCLQELALC